MVKEFNFNKLAKSNKLHDKCKYISKVLSDDGTVGTDWSILVENSYRTESPLSYNILISDLVNMDPVIQCTKIR